MDLTFCLNLSNFLKLGVPLTIIGKIKSDAALSPTVCVCVSKLMTKEKNNKKSQVDAQCNSREVEIHHSGLENFLVKATISGALHVSGFYARVVKYLSCRKVFLTAVCYDS